jgi:hypothetical protein
MIIPFIILGIFGIALIGGGALVLLKREVRTTSDLNRVIIFGWVGAAFMRMFFNPYEYKWAGWKKNVLGIVLILAGFASLYGAYLIVRMGLL